MKLHERHEPVELARLDIAKAVNDAIDKHGLTFGELFSILADTMARWAKFQVRDERSETKENDE